MSDHPDLLERHAPDGSMPAPPSFRPTVPGCIEGVIGTNPLTLQCSECGAVETPDPPTAMTIRFHPRRWSDGRTDNPRLCRSCRLARRCGCGNCRGERRR